MADSPQDDAGSLQGRLASLKKAQEARRRRAQGTSSEPPAALPPPAAQIRTPATTSSPTSSRTSLAEANSPDSSRPRPAAATSTARALDGTASHGQAEPGPGNGTRDWGSSSASSSSMSAASPGQALEPAQAWPHDHTPPGSAFTAQQWEQAQEGGSNVVFEVRNTAGESTLMVWPRTKDSAAFETLLFEGCLLLAPRAPHDYPQAVCGELKLKNKEFPWTYRVVRPQSHRQDRFFMFGARGTVDFQALPALQAAAQAESAGEQDGQAPCPAHDAGELRQRDRSAA
jgi:hypothetical protein